MRIPILYLAICTKDFSLRFAPLRVSASNADTIAEIINGESVELIMQQNGREKKRNFALTFESVHVEGAEEICLVGGELRLGQPLDGRRHELHGRLPRGYLFNEF